MAVRAADAGKTFFKIAAFEKGSHGADHRYAAVPATGRQKPYLV